MGTEAQQAKIDIPEPVEEIAKEAALAVLAKWIGKAFRWLRRR